MKKEDFNKKFKNCTYNMMTPKDYISLIHQLDTKISKAYADWKTSKMFIKMNERFDILKASTLEEYCYNNRSFI